MPWSRSTSTNRKRAKEIANQLIANGKVFKGYLGLSLQEVPINQKIARHHHLAKDRGLFVTGIEPDSPASRSELREGDIIVNFNNKAIGTLHELFKELSRKSILSMIDVSVIRHTELIELTVFPVQRQSYDPIT